MKGVRKMRNANNTVEQDTRVLIDHTLENLGWKLTGKGKNVFFEQPKTENERRKLDGKRPDYVLYSGSKPLIVIEAKRAGAKIDVALEQGIGYARILNAPLVFATDGVFCKSFHTFANRTPILNGEEIDEFIRESLALRFLNSYEVNTISPKVQYDRKELIRIFDEANNMLRGDGLRAGIERFGEFANILFLKLISENEQLKQDHNVPSSFDISSCGWDVIRKIPLSARIEYINNVYVKLNNLYQTEIFTPLIIRDATILEDIMDKLNPLTLTDVDSDVKGDAFEYFLRASASTKNDLGEYFTPRHIVKTMVRLINPKLGEKIYDPFCGTGGFLIETFRYIERSVNSKDPIVRKTLTEQTIFGNEITNTARITKMNMILAGDGHSNIHMCDSLANPTYIDKVKYDKQGKILRDDYGNIVYSSEYSGIYDVVITNMPYSQRTRHGNLYDLPSANGDSICVQHCIKAINSASENGRMALIVPEGFLFRKDLTKVREYLLSRCQLQSIISLPQGVFLPYTGVKTDIIYATKVNQKIKPSDFKKNFWYFEVKDDGYTLDNHRRKQDKPGDLVKYDEYRKLDSDQRDNMLKIGFEMISFEDVQKNSYVLVGSRYRGSELNVKGKFLSVKLESVAEIIRGISFPQRAKKTFITDDLLKVVTTKSAQSFGIDLKNLIYVDRSYIKPEKLIVRGDILISLANSLNLVGRVTYVDQDFKNLSFGAFMGVIRPDRTKINSLYLFYVLQSEKAKNYFKKVANTTTNISNLTFDDIKNFSFPLPSLDEQYKIVSELESYQKIIEGARQILDSYVPVLPDYTEGICVTLGDKNFFEIKSGGTPSSNIPSYWNGNINWITLADLPANDYITEIVNSFRKISEDGLKNSSATLLPEGSIVVSTRATIGRIGITRLPLATNQGFKNIIVKKKDVILPEFLALILKQKVKQMEELASGATFREISKSNFESLEVIIPPMQEQRNAIDRICCEKSLIEPSKQIIEKFTKKITTKMKEILGE